MGSLARRPFPVSKKQIFQGWGEARTNLLSSLFYRELMDRPQGGRKLITLGSTDGILVH